MGKKRRVRREWEREAASAELKAIFMPMKDWFTAVERHLFNILHPSDNGLKVIQATFNKDLITWKDSIRYLIQT